MWRLVRSTRGLFSSPRIAPQLYKNQAVSVYRVRLGKPRARLRNILATGALGFGCYALYSSVVISPLLQWVDDHEDQLTTEERRELDEIEPLFIAFPFTTQTVIPLPYAGTDPEWIEFVKISKDPKLQQKIRFSLANIVRRVGQNSAMLTMKCGKDMKVRRFWLELDFPYRPPNEYQRSGLLITDDAIEWTTRPVDSSTVTRTNRILWPSPLFLSTWAFAGTLLKQNAFDVIKMLGYDPKAPPAFPTAPGSPAFPANPGNAPALPPAHSSDMRKTIQRIRQQATTRPEEVKDPRAMVSQDRQIPDASPSAGSSAAGTVGSDGKGGNDPGSRPTTPDELFPGHGAMRSLTSGPWQEFKKKFNKVWKPHREHPPRGSVMVSGLVELDTSKASVIVDVFAWWDPKTKKFDARSMWMSLRRVQMKTQGPLRR